MKVELSEEAEADLEAIADYIARDNPVRALSFVLELRDRCNGLGTFPERFPSVEHLGKMNIRRCVHGNYLIFYEVGIETVSILHVRHGASDYRGLFDTN